MKKKIILIILILIICYYVACIVSTQGIMNRLRNVASGKEYIEDMDSPWGKFAFYEQFHPNVTKIDADAWRVFTFCYNDIGYICEI